MRNLFPILIMLLFLSGCSFIHKLFRKAEAPGSHQAQVVRKPIPEERLNTGGAHSKIVKQLHAYIYEGVRSAPTQQFIITEMPTSIEPPQRAVKIRLNPRKAATLRRLSTVKMLRNVPLKIPQKKQIKPRRRIKTLIISFPFDSASLSAHGIVKLKRFVHQYMDLLKSPHKELHPEGVVVAGYTCWLGPKAYNQSLALKRARAAALRLKEAGVTIRSVAGKGKCCYIDRKHPGPNRRAEVRLFSGEKGISEKGR
jgi:outer membrane protein OmpA-like peptidoglycan-associated protein